MTVTGTQTIKQYAITVNPLIREIKVTVTPATVNNIVVTATPPTINITNILGGGNYVDTQLIVTTNNQTIFNIFTEPLASNLIINDSTYFKDISYLIQEITGSWKLIWLEEFPLSTTDLLIYRKT